MNKIDNNKFAGIGMILGLLLGASINEIGEGVGLVIGMLLGTIADKINKSK